MIKEMVGDAKSAIGDDVVKIEHGSNVTFRSYLIDRPTPIQELKAAEAVLDIRIILSRPVQEVWPVFIEFNQWMNRFGYVWDKLPAHHEDGYVCLGNVDDSNGMKYGSQGTKNRYVVRKVVAGQLLYFDSLPYKLVDKDASFTGHNLMSMREIDGATEVSIFMEHTWYSDTVALDDLRTEARRVMFHDAVAFWRDYLIPDLTKLLDKKIHG